MSETLTAEESIEHLFELYADDVYRFARYSLQNTADAKDVVQEVFLRAFRAWDSFRQDSNPKTWIFHIARNYIYDLLRKKRTEATFQQTHQPDLSDVSVSLDTLVELEDAVEQLPPAYRQVFTLRCIQDLTVEETASILGWSQGKIKTTLHRAIKKLRTLLDDSETVHSTSRKEGGTGGYQ